jgi:hypothetical protein
MAHRDPLLDTIPLTKLRPTQITLGLREVAQKRAAWERVAKTQGREFLGRHMVPVLKGPKDHLYVIDHHHLARALMEEGVDAVLVDLQADLSKLSKEEFWVFCDNRGWCHPYDADGERVGFGHIPKALADMADDPFRSLAGALRRAGGCAKEGAPFSEFIWADFLRRRLDRAEVEKAFDAALAQALELAKGSSAAHLPGWSGPCD